MTFSITKHVKLSIALEVVVDNGFGVRRGLSPKELLVLDDANEVKAILPIHKEQEGPAWEYVARADLVREFAKLGVILK